MKRLLLLLLAVTACRGDAETPPPSPDVWIRGSVDERFALVSRHLRGFDVAMVETGYRYGELAWAGRDRNWEYAAYQLEKIQTAIANGIERRPKRAASARMIEGPLAAVRAAIERRDAAAFDTALGSLTGICNACHVAEQVAFVWVAPPAQRTSPVVGADPPAAAPAGTP